MAKRKRMTEEDIASAVSGQIDDARAYYGSDREGHREWALRFFEGEVDIEPMGEHRSRVVSRDVADTHGLILPGLLRIFFASTNIVRYEPTRPEHEDYADNASDLVNYVVMSECEGYKQFRAAMSDGLLLGNGIIKHWWDETPQYATDSYSGVSEEQFRLIQSELGDDDEVIDEEEQDDPDFQMSTVEEVAMMAIQAGADPMSLDPDALMASLPSLPPVPKLYDFKIKRMTSKGRLQLVAVPPEEFWIERSATTLDESVRFCAHVQRKTRSELIKAGYPRAKVDDIPLAGDIDRDTARTARDAEQWLDDVAPDASTQRVDIFECYVLIDTDGDGIAERRRIVMGGQHGKRAILANEEWGDDLPFSDIVPEPVPHRWRGRGLYDEMGDIQRINTVLTRGVLDNMYKVLVPQEAAIEGSILNPDEWMNPTFGGRIWIKPGGSPPVPVQSEFIVPQILPVIEYMNSVGEKRTGVSMRSQAMDIDALSNQSATAVNAAQAAAHSKVEEYARNIVKCGGMRRIFACILRLITKHQDRAKQVRLSGKFVEIDPTQWRNPDMNVTINTGLGTGSREKDTALMAAVVSKQEMILQTAGPNNPIVDFSMYGEALQKMAESGGARNPEMFFKAPTKEELAAMAQQQAQTPQQPDPKMLEAQAKFELRQQEIQFEQNERVARFRMEEAERTARMRLEDELKREQMAIDAANRQAEQELKLQLLRDEKVARIEIERERNAMMQQARIMEMNIEAQLKEMQMQLGRFDQFAANIPRPE